MAEYFCSDLHGEYELFMRLLDKCNLGCGDVVYVLGDVIDKGKNGFRLLDFIRRNKIFQVICGNHEYSLLQIYHDYMMEYTGENEDDILYKIQDFYPGDGKRLTWDMIDYLDALPFYIEKPDFICVHAGLQLKLDQAPLPMSEQNVNYLVFDRKFKEDRVIPKTEKTVLFGHTHCSYENGTGRFIKTPKPYATGETFADFSKNKVRHGRLLHGNARNAMFRRYAGDIRFLNFPTLFLHAHIDIHLCGRYNKNIHLIGRNDHDPA